MENYANMEVDADTLENIWLYRPVKLIYRTQMQKSILCFACGKESLTLDKESGEIVCSLCGVVMAERTEDPTQDRRTFLGDLSDKRRAGPYYSLSRRNKGFSVKELELESEDEESEEEES